MKKALFLCFIAIMVFTNCTTANKTVQQEEDATFQSISSHLMLGDPDKAIEAYENAYAEKPNDVDTRVLYVRLLVLAEKYEEARTELESILKTDINNADALFALSLIEGLAGKEKEEKEILEKIVKADEKHTEAMVSLARIYLDEKEFNKAKELLLKVKQNDEQNLAVLLGLGNISYKEKEYEKAEQYLDAAIKLDSEYPFTYIDRAKIKKRQGNYEGALHDLETASRLEPDYPYTYYDRGRIFMDRKERDKAIYEFSIALEKDPELFIAYVMRAGLYDEKDDYVKAIADYEKAIELKPNYYFSYEALGTLYFLTEKYEPAALMYGNAYNYDKSKHELVLLSALSLKFAGKEDEAKVFIKEKHKMLPRNTWYYHMATYYQDPMKDYSIVTTANQEKNEILKARILFYIAAQYLLQDKDKLAVIFFNETKGIDRIGIVEKRLALKLLEKYKK